ncbi:MAG: hypothetical protein U0K19_03520 [Bifidobacteriaceae bacterium]|nr:hypothetical protein [Bifidobacteriaceae bacterium]
MQRCAASGTVEEARDAVRVDAALLDLLRGDGDDGAMGGVLRGEVGVMDAVRAVAQQRLLLAGPWHGGLLLA